MSYLLTLKNEDQPSSIFFQIPIDVLSIIISCLDIKTNANLSLSCSRFRILCRKYLRYIINTKAIRYLALLSWCDYPDNKEIKNNILSLTISFAIIAGDLHIIVDLLEKRTLQGINKYIITFYNTIQPPAIKKISDALTKYVKDRAISVSIDVVIVNGFTGSFEKQMKIMYTNRLLLVTIDEESLRTFLLKSYVYDRNTVFRNIVEVSDCISSNLLAYCDIDDLNKHVYCDNNHSVREIIAYIRSIIRWDKKLIYDIGSEGNTISISSLGSLNKIEKILKEHPSLKISFVKRFQASQHLINDWKRIISDLKKDFPNSSIECKF